MGESNGFNFWSWDLRPEQEYFPMAGSLVSNITGGTNNVVIGGNFDYNEKEKLKYWGFNSYSLAGCYNHISCVKCKYDFNNKDKFDNHVTKTDNFICFGKKYGKINHEWIRKQNFWMARKATKLIQRWYKRWHFINGVLKIGRAFKDGKELWKVHQNKSTNLLLP